MPAMSRMLLDRIDLPVGTRQVHDFVSNHRNRLNSSSQSNSPSRLAGGEIECKCATGLNTNNIARNNRRSRHDVSGLGFPAQVTCLEFKRVEVAILAADNREIACD